MSILRRIALLIVLALLLRFTKMAIFGRVPDKPKAGAPSTYTPEKVPARNPAPATSYAVSEQGIGPLKVGMRIDAAEAALGSYFRSGYGEHRQRGFGCEWAQWPTAPVGVTVVLYADEVNGVLVDSGRVETDRHGMIGLREDVLLQYYTGTEIDSAPDYRHGDRKHRTVTIRPDTAVHDRILIFEIQDDTVQSYRAGNAQAIRERRGC